MTEMQTIDGASKSNSILSAEFALFVAILHESL